MKIKTIDKIISLETEDGESYIRLSENNWLELIGRSFEYYHDSEYLEEKYQEFINSDQDVYWCAVHKRLVTYKDENGNMKCDPKLGGILAICDVVKKEKCCENESNIEIDIKFPEAKSLNDSYQF